MRYVCSKELSLPGKSMVRFTDLVLPSPGNYYLTWNDNRELSSAAKTLQSWLINEAARCVEE